MHNSSGSEPITNDCRPSESWRQGDIPDDCHPGIWEITEHWRSIHPGSGLPGRRHLDPARIPRLLANIRLIDVVGDPPRFRVRLTGTRLTEFFGASDTGRWLDEIDANFGNSQTCRNYACVIRTRQLNWRRGQRELAETRTSVQYERVQLPLASDGDRVDLILTYGVFGRLGEPAF